MSSKQQLIRVKTKITLPDGANEEIVQNTEGTLYLKDNDYFLRYKEVNQEELGESWTTIKWPITEQEVTIIRQGNIRMKQTFILHQEESGYYHTPLGVLDIKTKTSYVQIDIENKVIVLDYELWVNQERAGRYEVNISYREINGK